MGRFQKVRIIKILNDAFMHTLELGGQRVVRPATGQEHSEALRFKAP